MKRTLFLPHSQLVGIDISHTYVKCMSINTPKWTVSSYGSTNADPQKLHNSLTESPDYLIGLLRDLTTKNMVGTFTGEQAVISIPTNLTYSRSVSLPKAAVKKIDEAIALEASQYIPVASSELNLSYEILSETDQAVDILMAAAPKRIIDNVYAACQEVGITPLLIQPSINAVAKLITSTEQGHLPTVIVDIGTANTDVAILNERIRATATVQVGSNTLTYAISEKMNITLEAAHQMKVLHGLSHGSKQQEILEAVNQPLSQVVNEIHKIIRYYNERLDASARIEQIIIVGSGSDIPGLGEYFTDNLVMPARVASPWQNLEFGPLPQPAKQFRPRYITVIGLAATTQEEVKL
ncbi:pilus assembly protein PilM [Candidatus Saccharibacteria bacterium]|nr:pilus assembly protein PilM [Candidatus Saccharibacteria bacterium]